MTTDLATYAEIVNQAWNSHDLENVLRYYSPDYVGSDVGQSALQQGHQGLRTMVERYWRAFPDLQFLVTDKVIQASRATIVWEAEEHIRDRS